MLKTVSAVCVSVLVVFVLVSCGGKPETNVLIITVDTLRADRLGCYGYEGAKTPAADNLAEEGVLFEKASSVTPLTLPSHVSLFTGLYPVSHGVRENTMFRLSSEYSTLAEILSAKGYATGAVVASEVLASFCGLAQGFEFYDDSLDAVGNEALGLVPEYRRGETVTRKALEWVFGINDKPFFLWTHYFDPHFPYNAPEPFGSDYASKPYDGEVAYADFCVGNLLNRMREKGKLDNTIVIYLSDHGEALGEHGELTHGYFAYEETISIPMIIRFPDGDKSGKRVKDIVSIIDIFPTLLEYLSVQWEGESEGVSLLPSLNGEGSARDYLFFESMGPYYSLGWSGIAGIRKGDVKYLCTSPDELYDLAADPEETANLLLSVPAVPKGLRGMVFEEYISWEPLFGEPEFELSPERIEKLRSLGYLQGDTGADLVPGAEYFTGGEGLKESLETWNLFLRASSLWKAGMAEKAISLMNTILEDSAGHNYLFIKTLADMNTGLSRYADTVACLGRLASIYRSESVIDDIEKYKALADRQSRDIEGFEKAVADNPRNADGWAAAVRYFVDLKDFSKAMEWLDRGFAVNPRSHVLHNSYGIILSMTGEAQKGMDQFRKAIAIAPDYTEAHMNLGFACFNIGDTQGAKKYLTKALELEPDNPKARQMMETLSR